MLRSYETTTPGSSATVLLAACAAIAGRVGLSVDLRHFNALSESTPVLVNLKPTGPHYMEDFHAAGGMGAVLQELRPLLNLECPSVTGENEAAGTRIAT